MSGNIGLADLVFILAQSPRLLLQNNWLVGAGATDTIIPVFLRNPLGTAVNITGTVQAELVGATVEFTSGALMGASRSITAAAANGTLILDIALPSAPALFTSIIIQRPVAGIGSAVNTNVAEWGGTAQTGADLTPNLQNLDAALSTLAAEASLISTLARNVAEWGGTAQTGADLTPSIQNLDAALSTRAAEATLAKMVPIAKATVFNAATAGNANLLGADISPTNSPSILRVTIALDAATTFRAHLTRAAVTVVLNYNSAANLTADSVFVFDLPWRSGDTVNFQTGGAATVLVLNAEEVGAAT